MQIEFTEKLNDTYDYKIITIGKDIKNQTFEKNNNDVIKRTFKNGNFQYEFGELIKIPSEKIIFICIGNNIDLTEQELKKLGGIIGSEIKNDKVKTSLLITDHLNEDKKFKLAMGILLKSHTFDKYKSNQTNIEQTIFIHTQNPKKAQNDFESTQSLIDGINFARDITNEPSNIMTTNKLTEIAKDLKKLKLKVDIYDEKALKKLNANLILSVGQGSINPPYIVAITYTGNPKSNKKIAFIGKGLCFDSGGISIKPSNGMEEMKMDMAGAGTVIGIMQYIAKSKPKINIIGMLGIAENIPSNKSYKPGDILTSLKGKTVEVLNTDAEGRLVLADCLTLCQIKYKPTIMIDFATLTGAALSALGTHRAPIMGTSQKLIDNLITSGEKTGNLLWQLPLEKEYNELIKSKIADIKNIGPAGIAGSILGGEFLHEFVENTDWAHIDIAGTAMLEKENDISPNGASGFGVELAADFIKNHI